MPGNCVSDANNRRVANLVGAWSLAAAQAVQDATDGEFGGPGCGAGDRFPVPAAFKRALSPFIGVAPEEIILGNRTSYGLHLLSHGIRWNEGDEVLLVAGEFPATVVPWLWLEQRGVRIRMLEPRTAAARSDAAGRGHVVS
jgi:hypothetical protein